MNLFRTYLCGQDGSKRMILNLKIKLKKISNFVGYDSSKMESINNLITLRSPGYIWHLMI